MSEQEAAAGSQFTPTPAAPEATEPPKKSGGAIKKILGVVVVIIVVIAVKFAVGAGLGELWDNITGSVTTASVGDCVNEFQDVDDAKVVDCADPEAKNKVVGLVEDKFTKAAFSAQMAAGNPCSAFPTAIAAIWYGTGTGTGDVWCLAAK
ncbi:hypothetical protein Cme02nite_17330 [Catellatospora methionotrophica]|uniref:Septum formation-related domain-containing protein n=1 Tax=Catellatospora methionotrophica TaxID=121620 RepID=A0A8J3LE13_9ACTN|nr:hypothetical protein [Catellatospora methionotrophica]GIG13401.1 hypothetical protein Cme02nite_17330 [Catellatospora methionotrophica]